MKVDYKNNKLQRQCADDSSRLKAFGKVRARKLRMRLTSLEAALNMEDLRHVPGRFHELTANRKDQFAADLDHPFRLIFVPVLSTNEKKLHKEGLIWQLITSIKILSIEDYHE